jgi:multidrug efflux pump
VHTEEEFGNIILKTAQDGSLVRLLTWRVSKWVPAYALRAQLNNQDAVGIGIFQSPGANAIDLSNAVRAKMDELSTRFPQDMKWAAPYDPTVFVRDSIRAVVQTLLEAVVLVVLVVILFLQTWRVDYSADRGAGLGGGDVQHSLPARLLAEHPEPVRAGTGHRYRGG